MRYSESPLELISVLRPSFLPEATVPSGPGLWRVCGLHPRTDLSGHNASGRGLRSFRRVKREVGQNLRRSSLFTQLFINHHYVLKSIINGLKIASVRRLFWYSFYPVTTVGSLYLDSKTGKTSRINVLS